mgnify:CR=1 FL=1
MAVFLTWHPLKVYRLKNELTQKQLARQLRLHENTIMNIESGKRVSIKVIKKIADFLNLDPLLFVDEEPISDFHEVRIRLGMSQAELGELFQVDEHTISRWEHGITKPRTKIREEVEDYLDIEF